MKAVSVRQPWASAAVLGGTHVLPMPFATRYRGELLIHADRWDPRANHEDVRQRLAGQHYADRSFVLLGVVHLDRGLYSEVCDLPWSIGPVNWIVGGCSARVFIEPIPWPRFSGLIDIGDPMVMHAVETAITPQEFAARAMTDGLTEQEVYGPRPADGWRGD